MPGQLERVVGHPNYSYGGTEGDYIPVLYGKQLLIEYLERAVVPGITNHDYEGDIKDQGDSVIISALPEVAIEDHERGAAVGTYEQLVGSSQTLEINYAKKYKFVVDVIDAKQARFVLAPKFLMKAEYAMEMAIDTHWFSITRADADSSNQGNTAGADSAMYSLGVTSSAPKVLTSDNVLDWIADIATVLSEQSVPEDDERWMALPPWVTNLIDQSALQDAGYSGKGMSLMYKNRWKGRLKGFNIHQTMSSYKATVNSKSEFSVLAGHKPAVTFATQLVRSDKLQDAQIWGDLYRGLQVYGFKTVEGKGLTLTIAVSS